MSLYDLYSRFMTQCIFLASFTHKFLFGSVLFHYQTPSDTMRYHEGMHRPLDLIWSRDLYVDKSKCWRTCCHDVLKIYFALTCDSALPTGNSQSKFSSLHCRSRSGRN